MTSLLDRNGPKLSPLRLTHLLHQVALGFVALGDAMIVHRDLAARNVLIDEFVFLFLSLHVQGKACESGLVALCGRLVVLRGTDPDIWPFYSSSWL